MSAPFGGVFGLGYVPPLRRLHLCGNDGIPVGPKSAKVGGLRTNTAENFAWDGIAILAHNPEGKIVRAYATQLAFDFYRFDSPL